MASDTDGHDGSKVSAPTSDEVRTVLTGMLENNKKIGRYFCGADLEEAVNRAYIRAAQAANNPSIREFVITIGGLREGLEEVPRSIHREAIDSFLADVRRYCSDAVCTQLTNRLSPAGMQA